MKLSKTVMKWLLSFGELVILIGVIAFMVVMLKKMQPPSAVQDTLVVVAGVIFGVAIAAYLLFLWIADFPPNENSLINRVVDPASAGALTWKDKVALWIGDLIREDKRLASQLKRAAEKPQNASLAKEVMKKVNKEPSRRQREVTLRYALMTLDERDKALAQAKRAAKKKKIK